VVWIAAALALGAATVDVVRARHALTRHVELERVRLRAHFDSVDRELLAVPTGHLSDAQGRARLELIRWLREYRDAGVFPRNDDYPHVAMPYFRDAHGASCAMANLISRSGREDMVRRIAGTANNARVAALAADPPFRQWLDSVGLTLGEAARIQPQYGPQRESTVPYLLSTWAVSGTALISAGFNTFTPRKSWGWLGVASGTTAMLLGLARIDAVGEDQKLAAANLVIGAGATALGVRGLMVGGRSRGGDGATKARRTERPREVFLGPMLSTSRQQPTLGLVMRARF